MRALGTKHTMQTQGYYKLLPTALSLAVTFGASVATAEDSTFRSQERAPQPQLENAPEVLPSLPSDTVTGKNQETLVNELKGVVVYQNAALYKECLSSIEATNHLGLVGHFPEGFETVLSNALNATYIGQPLSLKTVAEINATIRKSYRAVDDHIMMTYAPAGQRVSSGVLCTVLEPLKVGTVETDNQSKFSLPIMEEQFELGTGDDLRMSYIYDEVAWLNRNPFRSATLTFAPGKDTSTSDLDVQVRGKKTWRASLSEDNNGNLNTGRYRTIATLSGGNLWDKGHVAAVNLIKTNKSDRYDGAGFYYLAPLPWKHELAFNASYSDSEYPLGDTGAFELEDTQLSLGLDYMIPLHHHLFDETIYRHELSFGHTFKKVSTDTTFGNTTVSEKRYDVSQFSFEYSADITDRNGKSDITAGLVLSPGSMTSRNDRDDLITSRVNEAEHQYSYAFATLERAHNLNKGYQLFGRLSGQLTNERLPSTELFSAGGINTVRGFENDVISADSGVGLTVEVRTPAISSRQLFNSFGSSHDRFRAHLFYDGARTWLSSVSPVLEGEQQRSIQAVGVGFRYGYKLFSSRLELGLPIKDSDKEYQHQIARFSVALSY